MSSAPDPAPAPVVLSARTPADLAAFVPLALGFVPERSVVLLSVGARGGMHARVDLPHDPDDVDDVVHALLRPALRNRVREAVVVVYDDDTTVADEAAWALHEELGAAGITVHEVLRVHDDHWYAVLPGAPLPAYRGTPVDRDTHPFTLRGVVEGRVTHRSREDLRRTLAPDGPAVERTATALPGAAPLAAGEVGALVRRHLDDGRPLAVDDLAAVALTFPDGSRRDEAWVGLTRADAWSAVALWSDAVRRLPGPHVASVAAVLAFSAWLAGDGALAWCAVDRAREQRPGHSLADLVAQLLETATSPDRWEELRSGLTGSLLDDDPAA